MTTLQRFLAAGLIAAGAFGAASLAQARDVTWSVGLAGPGVAVGVGNAPAYPVYSQPVYTQPVYAQPVYTQPVYTQPVYNAPVYAQPAPVYVAPPAYYAPPRVVYRPAPVIYAPPARHWRHPHYDRWVPPGHRDWR